MLRTILFCLLFAFVGSIRLLADPTNSFSAQAPPVAPVTNAVNVSPPPPKPLEDYFVRYGHIVGPGNEPTHPLKLSLPMPGLPDIGSVRIPSRDELDMHDKLDQLATFSDADIRAQLEQWPAYGKMNLNDEGTMLVRIQQFKDQRKNIAKAKAHEIGLSTLTPEQQQRFEKEYWEKRRQLDRDLAKQFEPVFKARQQKMQEELFREFSLPNPPASSPAPPAPTNSGPPVAAPKSSS